MMVGSLSHTPKSALPSRPIRCVILRSAAPFFLRKICSAVTASTFHSVPNPKPVRNGSRSSSPKLRLRLAFRKLLSAVLRCRSHLVNAALANSMPLENNPRVGTVTAR